MLASSPSICTRSFSTRQARYFLIFVGEFVEVRMRGGDYFLVDYERKWKAGFELEEGLPHAHLRYDNFPIAMRIFLLVFVVGTLFGQNTGAVFQTFMPGKPRCARDRWKAWCSNC